MENIIDEMYSDAVKRLDEEILKDCDVWFDYVLNLPKAQQVAYTVILLHWQIENGGFHQYFFNSYWQFAYLTIKNLKLIEASQRADLLDSATHLVNEEYLIENVFRNLIFNRELSKIVDLDDVIFSKLNELDDKYYSSENEDISILLGEYLNKQSKN